ncbi:uncharacterized protein LOC124788950 [Schistocerca piceifrons]|uniref:uncharacterized protein LOC124788950 n=1 Tax=Schistocerca piceifrons TaxID=274613 RepID=UPI001F5E4271|nr:uncharacterized protein LOC124788950 [Schistocerca piceifrons]
MSERKQKQRLKKARRMSAAAADEENVASPAEGPSSSRVMGKHRERDEGPSVVAAVAGPAKRHHKRERWLMTRKTWRYMADAGRRLIPEGVRNRPEDLPKVEAHFQEVCRREPRFLLWRKASYPGALGFRRKQHHRRKKGGSCRERMVSSADEAEEGIAPSGTGALLLKPEPGGRFDLQRLRREFLLGPDTADGDTAPSVPPRRPDSLPLPGATGFAFRPQRQQLSPTSEEAERKEFLELLKEVLDQQQGETGPDTADRHSEEIDFDKLLEHLRAVQASPDDDSEPDSRGFVPLQTVKEHTQLETGDRKLALGSGQLPPARSTDQLYYQLKKTDQSKGETADNQFRVNLRKVEDQNQQGGSSQDFRARLKQKSPDRSRDGASSRSFFPTLRSRSTPDVVGGRTPETYGERQGSDFSSKFSPRSESHYAPPTSQHQMLLDTLRRHYSKSTSRQKVISDLLTDRKLLAKLYFDLQKSREFGRRKGGGSSSPDSPGFWKEAGSGSAEGQYRLRRREDGHRAAGGDAYDKQDFSGWKRSGRQQKQRSRDASPFSPPPLIEVQEDEEERYASASTQTPPIPASTIAAIEEHIRKREAAAKEEKEPESSGKEAETAETYVPQPRRRSSVDHDDVSPSVSDTIKRYLRMARKKSVDADKQDRFKRVNYDRNLRNIRPKGEIGRPGDDDGLGKGAQTEQSWVEAMRELHVEDVSASEAAAAADAAAGSGAPSDGSRAPSSRSSFDAGSCSGSGLLSPPSPGRPQGLLASGHSFLQHLLHGLQQSSSSAPAASAVAGGVGVGGSGGAAGPVAMQKSKSSSSVVHHGSRLVAKKIWRARSKSQSRASALATCTWTPQGNCTWSNVSGRQVQLSDVPLLQLSEPERLVLAQVALAKLRALNLGVTVRVPSDTVAAPSHKPKRRAYLLKRKALTTGFFDTGRAKDADKDKENTGQVFGVPLSQCVETERVSRLALRGSRSGDLRQQSRHGSRSSFSSLIEGARPEESGSCESLLVGSVPGLLDSLSCGSSADILTAPPPDDEPCIPGVVAACLNHLETYGLNTLGIFRVSTSKKRVRQLREDFDCGKDITLGRDHCPHDVATLLKEYFRDLPEPLLCRDLYPAFVQTQRIRNRRLQYEALQHLIQLLPVANRDTLWSLVSFLANVARHAPDTQDASGEWVLGNKMDSNNLATVFAPNILHCVKPGASKDIPTTQERAEDRIDVINVLRTMIDHYRDLFMVPAELLDEVYVHMMDSHPDALNQLLNKRAGTDDVLDDLETPTQESESTSTPRTPTADVLELHLEEPAEASEAHGVIRRMWSREEFLHETAGMGGPDVAMRPRHKERTRERPSKKRWREEPLKHNRPAEGDSRKSSDASAVSGEGTVITASLKIPVPGSLGIDESDIPFIEDSGCSASTDSQQGAVHGSTTRRRRQHSASGSDSSQTSIHPSASADSALGSSSVATTTVSSPPRHATPPSLCSSASPPPSWASSPPTSPDAAANASFVGLHDDRTTHLTAGAKSSSVTAYQRQQSEQVKGTVVMAKEVAPIILQKVTFASTSELRQTQKVAEQAPVIHSKEFPPTVEQHHVSKGSGMPVSTLQVADQLSKSASTSSMPSGSVSSKQVIVQDPKTNTEALEQRLSGDRKYTASISSIGGAVLRSKTADIERMLRIEKVENAKAPQVVEPTHQGDQEDKKKYTKRRYTESRHQTRHIPDVNALRDAGVAADMSVPTVTAAQRRNQQQQGPVYKRRELIASDPKQNETFL